MIDQAFQPVILNDPLEWALPIIQSTIERAQIANPKYVHQPYSASHAFYVIGDKRYCIAGFPTLPPSGPDEPPLVGEIRVLVESETDPGTFEVQQVIKADEPDLGERLDSFINGRKDQSIMFTRFNM